jgi:hypothetical protein
VPIKLDVSDFYVYTLKQISGTANNIVGDDRIERRNVLIMERTSNNGNTYETLKLLPLITVFNGIKTRKSFLSIDNYNVKCANSMRLQVFYKKGVECVFCGIEGTFFALQTFKNVQKQNPHINLYAGNPYDTSETWTLMTRDHIIPRSKGGLNTIENQQTMCCECNLKKGNKLIWRFNETLK